MVPGEKRDNKGGWGQKILFSLVLEREERFKPMKRKKKEDEGGWGEEKEKNKEKEW